MDKENIYEKKANLIFENIDDLLNKHIPWEDLQDLNIICTALSALAKDRACVIAYYSFEEREEKKKCIDRYIEKEIATLHYLKSNLDEHFDEYDKKIANDFELPKACSLDPEECESCQ